MRAWQAFEGRFRLLFLMWAVTLVLNTVVRVGLAHFGGVSPELTLGITVHVFTLGWLYDSAFFLFASLPALALLWLAPNAIWRSWAGQGISHFGVLISLYVLGFAALAEFIFWDEFHSRFNFIAVDYLVYTQEVIDNVLQSYPVGLMLMAIGVGVLVLYWPLRPLISSAHDRDEGFVTRTTATAAWFVLTLLVGLGVSQTPRNGFANSLQAELASNGPYQFFAAFRNNELDYSQFYATIPDAEAAQTLRTVVEEPNARYLSGEPFDIERQITNPGSERRRNVVLVTLESFNASYLSQFGSSEGAGLTPFLDGLIDQSLFFEHFYATGTRTVRGLEAVTLSIPPTPGRSIVKRIGRESGMWSLGNVLRSKGYSTRFIYGGRGYFDNMNAFFSGNGYEITDQSSVPGTEMTFTNAWGMSDEDLYRQVVREADRAAASNAPFFFHVMTTSNHRPYTYPEGRIDIPSGSGRAGAVKYTDYALRQFIEQARQQPWFENTLFVILADHTANAAGKRALPVDRYHIPLWIYAPALIQPARVATVASQIDLAPTLLGLLNMSYRSKAFGHDVLNFPQGKGRALIANYQSLGLFQPGRLVVLSPVKRMETDALAGDRVIAAEEARIDDPLVRQEIALYQGASYIYRRHLNAWSPPPLANLDPMKFVYQ